MKIFIISGLVVMMLTKLSAQVTQEDVFDHKLMFNDLYNIKEYQEALPYLKWLLVNAPDVDESIYIKGVRTIDAILKNVNAPEERLNLQEFALKIYDQRMEYFGEKAIVKNLQLTTIYKYFIKNIEKYDSLLSLFEIAISEKIDSISNTNFLAYFDILRRTKRYNLAINEKLVLSNYSQISELMTKRDKKDGYDAKIETFLTEVIPLSCERIEQIFRLKLQDSIESVRSAKMLVNLSLKKKCTNSDIFNEALDLVIKYEPTTNILLYKAKKALKKNQLKDAEMYFGKALIMNDKVNIESDIYLNLAKIYTLRNQKSKASEYAFKSIKTNNNNKAYSLIGNLYMSSFTECVGENDLIERRAVFIAAYDMFEKANDTKNMAIAKSQFPSMEEIHMNSYALGQEVSVNCWFQKTVSIKKRDY